jgi:N-methylhydantoinase B/oxoprolinase/acetone carboxylase alpha subunit
VFLVESGGGGGYGDPRRRAPAARAYDRENGFVTRGPGRTRPARRAKAARARPRKAR